MTPSASDHARGSRARCRSAAAILGAGLLLTSLGAAGAIAKTPARTAPAGKDIAALGSSSKSVAAAQNANRKWVEGELIVRFKSGADRSAARRSENAKLKDRIEGIDGAEVLRIERGRSPEAAARSFERRSDVLYAEPNYLYKMQATTNDSRLKEYWGHNNTGQTVNGAAGVADADMDVFEAWNIQQSSPNVLVSVIDTGVAYDHPDLAPNMWINPGESCTAALPNRCTNKVDDDANGYVDDVRGMDFINNDSDPRDDQGHGSHVAGTIAARGNNDVAGANATDFVGVSTQARIQAIKVLAADGFGSNDAITKGIIYAGKTKAKVVNMSLGGGGASQLQSDAIKNASSSLFIIAAGNGGQDGVGDNNDTTPSYPCSYTQPPNIVCVAATNQSDQFTSFSNYGATSVDVAAPGQNILSTMPAFRNVWAETFATNPFTAGTWTRGGTPNTWAHDPDDLVANGTTPIPSITDSPNGATYAPDTDNWARRTSAANLTGLMNCALEYVTVLDAEAYFDEATQEWDVYDWLAIEAATSSAGPWTELAYYFGSGSAALSDSLGSFNGKSSVFLRYRFVSDDTEEWDGAYIVQPSLKCLGTSYNATDGKFNNGTSMATPNVAGVAALMYGKFPSMTVAQGRTRLLQSVDVKAALNQPGKKVATGGRINAYKALSQTTAATASGVLTVTAGKGSTNNIVVTRLVENGIVKHRVTDPYGATGVTGSRVVPGTVPGGCVADTPTSVKCTGVTSVKILADDMNDTVNTVPVAGPVIVPVNVDGGLGNDTLTTGAGADTLTGGLGADKFTSGGANDTINAKNDDLDTSFACGETAGDSDKVNADITPNDPVTQSATNCEVVSKT